MNMNASPWGNGPKSGLSGVSFVQFAEIEEEAKLQGVQLTVKKIDRTSINNDPKHQHRLISEKATRESVDAIKSWLRFGRNDMRRLLVMDYGNGKYALYDGNHRFIACCELKIPELECYVMPVGTEHRIAETIASNVNDRHGTRLASTARSWLIPIGKPASSPRSRTLTSTGKWSQTVTRSSRSTWKTGSL